MAQIQFLHCCFTTLITFPPLPLTASPQPSAGPHNILNLATFSEWRNFGSFEASLELDNHSIPCNWGLAGSKILKICKTFFVQRGKSDKGCTHTDTGARNPIIISGNYNISQCYLPLVTFSQSTEFNWLSHRPSLESRTFLNFLSFQLYMRMLVLELTTSIRRSHLKHKVFMGK